MAIRRYGRGNDIEPQKIEYYKKLHPNPWSGALDMIKECNIQMFSIFLKEIEGKQYRFATRNTRVMI